MKYPNNIYDWRIIIVGEQDLRPKLLDIANAISTAKKWDWIKKISPPKNQNYGFWRDTNIFEIEKHMVYTKSHTASSFNYCMKQMKIIAKNGFDKWNNPTIKNKKNVKVTDRGK